MTKVYLLLISTILLFNFGGAHAETNYEKEAIAVAQSWLNLIDKEKYRESWQQSSSLFRRSVTVEQWVDALGKVKANLGKKITRKFSSAKHHTTLPGAPDGNYMVIVFETSFEKKKKSIETITPMLDDDGVWRISGYYVQ